MKAFWHKLPHWSRVLILTVLIAAALVGATFGILTLVRNNSNVVSVYPASNMITDYSWGNQAETQGIVSTDNVQTVYISDTQQVTEIYVQEGDEVQIGDPILAFDTTLTDLQLERQGIQVKQLELDLQNAKNDLARINTYKVISQSEPEATPAPDYSPVETPYLRTGNGTAETPYRFVWSEDCVYTNAFINSFLPQYVPPTPVEPTEPEEGGETPPEGGDAQPEGGDALRMGFRHPKWGGGEPEEPVTLPTVYAVFELREGTSLEGGIINSWEIVFVRTEDGGYNFTIQEPTPEQIAPILPDNPVIDNSVYMTWAEIVALKAEAQKRITDTELNLKKAQLQYDTLEYELTNGIITAKVNGVVKTIRTRDEALEMNLPLVLISGGGGFSVTGTLGELELDSMSVGATVTVQSWESGANYECEIVEISEYPDTSGGSYHWSQGNQNVSLYPFKIYLPEDAQVRENEWVYITYFPRGSSNGIYLDNAFIRQENGKSYIFAADAEGRLEKRFIKTGASLWGSYTEILGGMTAEDRLAFPYGRSVREGAKTVEASIDELYNYY